MAEIGNHPGAPASSRNLALNCKGILIPSFPENGTANSITAFIEGNAGPNYRAFIIDPADGITVLAQSDMRTNIGTNGYYTFSGGSLASFSLVFASSYILAIGSEDTGIASAFFESGAETYDGQTAGSGISSVNPLTFNSGGMGADSTRDYAIYLDYTPGGGPPTGLPFVSVIGAKRI